MPQDEKTKKAIQEAFEGYQVDVSFDDADRQAAERRLQVGTPIIRWNEGKGTYAISRKNGENSFIHSMIFPQMTPQGSLAFRVLLANGAESDLLTADKLAKTFDLTKKPVIYERLPDREDLKDPKPGVNPGFSLADGLSYGQEQQQQQQSSGPSDADANKAEREALAQRLKDSAGPDKAAHEEMLERQRQEKLRLKQEQEQQEALRRQQQQQQQQQVVKSARQLFEELNIRDTGSEEAHVDRVGKEKPQASGKNLAAIMGGLSISPAEALAHQQQRQQQEAMQHEMAQSAEAQKNAIFYLQRQGIEFRKEMPSPNELEGGKVYACPYKTRDGQVLPGVFDLVANPPGIIPAECERVNVGMSRNGDLAAYKVSGSPTSVSSIQTSVEPIKDFKQKTVGAVREYQRQQQAPVIDYNAFDSAFNASKSPTQVDSDMQQQIKNIAINIAKNPDWGDFQRQQHIELITAALESKLVKKGRVRRKMDSTHLDGFCNGIQLGAGTAEKAIFDQALGGVNKKKIQKADTLAAGLQIAKGNAEISLFGPSAKAEAESNRSPGRRQK